LSWVEGKSDGDESVPSTGGSSANVPGVTAGAKAICWGAARDFTGSVHVSRTAMEEWVRCERDAQ
jgi:hypothetical protein